MQKIHPPYLPIVFLFSTKLLKIRPKLWAEQTEKPKPNRKIHPLWGEFGREID
jgi:hypothetical protein